MSSPPERVKVYCWYGGCSECDSGGPSFTEDTLYQPGDFYWGHEPNARMIPAGQLARWKAAAAAWEQVQDEIIDALKNLPGPSPCRP